MNRIWLLKKDKIKLKFDCITEKDLVYSIGKEYEMVERLAEKLGKTNEEVLGIIIDF